jgi:hypothetical protein
MPQVEGGTATVGTPGGGGGGGDKLSQVQIKQVATLLGISPAKAKALITAYHNEHGGTWAQSVKGAYLQGGGSSGSTGSSSSSSSGSSGSSSSGGSSGGSTGPSPQALANAKASYANMLKSWGIPITPGLDRMITQAVASGMGSSMFLQQLRRTKDYARAFKGIMRGDGTLRMTEAQYISGYNQAKDLAASVGRAFSRDAYGLAIKNGNSPSELKSKIEAIDTLKTNRDVFQQFNEYLVAKGLADPKKGVTKPEMLQFIMKQGPAQWEREWGTASQAAELAKMEIDVGKPKTGSDISYKELQKLQKNLPQGQEPDYGQLAEALKSLPASKLYGYGLTKKSLLTLAYNGKGAAQIAEVATRALAQYRIAVTEPGAQPNLTQSQSGTQVLTGRRPTQASE